MEYFNLYQRVLRCEKRAGRVMYAIIIINQEVKTEFLIAFGVESSLRCLEL